MTVHGTSLQASIQCICSHEIKAYRANDIGNESNLNVNALKENVKRQMNQMEYI